MPHPTYLEEGWRPEVKFKCGYDIAVAEIELMKGSSHLSNQEVDELKDKTSIPLLRPIDLLNSEFKFAFIPGYPSLVYQDGYEQSA